MTLGLFQKNVLFSKAGGIQFGVQGGGKEAAIGDQLFGCWHGANKIHPIYAIVKSLLHKNIEAEKAKIEAEKQKNIEL